MLQTVYGDIHQVVDALAAAGTHEEALRTVAAEFKLELWQAQIVIDQQLWHLTGKAKTDRMEMLRQDRTDDDLR